MSNTSAPRIFQIRLGTLLLLTTWCGIVFAGLANPTQSWRSIVSGFSLFSILVAAVVAIYRTGQLRAIALGFLIFAGGYLLYYRSESPGILLPYLLGTNLEGSDSISMILYAVFHGEKITPTFSPGTGIPSNLSPVPPDFHTFFAITNHAFATLVGCVGSLIAQYLHATQRRELDANDGA